MPVILLVVQQNAVSILDVAYVRIMWRDSTVRDASLGSSTWTPRTTMAALPASALAIHLFVTKQRATE